MHTITIPVGDKLREQAQRYQALLEKPLSATSEEDFVELTTLFKSMSMRLTYTALVVLQEQNPVPNGAG